MEFMLYEGSIAFIAAVKDVFGIDLSSNDEPILEGTVHHGVYTGPGDPLSSHTLDPNDDSRVLMQVDSTGAIAILDEPYDTTNPSFDGICLDSLEQQYSFVKSVALAQIDLQACPEFCQDFNRLSDQVGFTFVENAGKGECFCWYDNGKLPTSLSELTEQIRESSGTGPVNSGDDTSGTSTYFCYINKNYQSRSAIVTYSDVWKGKTPKPTAIFATPIRLDIAPNGDEELEFPFKKDGSQSDTWNDNIYFALTKSINLNGVLAVTNFGESRKSYTGSSSLPSFSFLTIDTLRRYGASFLSGVVAYNGLMRNSEGIDEFDVEKGGDAFIFNYSTRSYDIDKLPTVLAFPNWFSIKDEHYPQDTVDITFAISEISATGFQIKHGPSSRDSYLGFNFAVIGPDMPKENIKHGIITQCTRFHGTIYPKYGISVEPTDFAECTPNGSLSYWVFIQNTETDPDQLGVKVVFDSKFADIPSVIATPYIPGNTWDLLGIPRCVVESITKSSAVVKCGQIIESADIATTYEPIPFTFVAVGNKFVPAGV